MASPNFEACPAATSVAENCPRNYFVLEACCGLHAPDSRLRHICGSVSSMQYAKNRKAIEERCRRASERQGYRLVKNPLRDPLALGFNTWRLHTILPQRKCADPMRGHANERFEPLAFGPATLVEVMRS